jgi:predicted helicase
LSQLLIQQYYNDLAAVKRVAGTNRESVIREAFKDLLKAWGRSQDLDFVAEYKLETKAKERRYVDGALLYALRVPFGYWESKDSNDDLDAEIDKKFRAGYPKTNIIFEDSAHAVLFQHGEEVMRCSVEESDSFEKLLTLYFGYERPEIEAFRKAVEQFKTDLPNVLGALRSMISRAHGEEPEFRKAAGEFLAHAKEVINPNLVDADVREMLIQHILTGEVFEAVFPGTTFHEDNNVARELQKLEATFFTGNTKFQTLKGLEPYYGAIRKAAAQIATHSEKQSFLKAIYENFYKVYNPKAADRLGVVYTPNEIVRFMVEGADWLCEQHFRRNLIDEDVDILDPATGTGTFLCEMIDHFAGQPKKLTEKYLHSIHANEVAILPYYVANLNIEATYAAIIGRYEEFPGLCFVDTLDNVFALRKFRGHMDDLFGAVADDNMKRIRNQNGRRISVIIGNPPYNANQRNENENNKNREYKEIDNRIKRTYVKESRAQKTKVYDMYSRFFRWASDRLDENGILAFITNRSFIEKRTFDGFRAVVATEFSEIRVLDLGGDVIDNPKLNGPTHNVFGIPTGVAISFMVRRGKQRGCRIFYARRPEMETAEEKLSFLSNTALRDVSFEEVRPDPKHNWINQTSNDFDSLLPLAAKETKAAAREVEERAIFKMFSLGVATNRDEWVYDHAREALFRKVSFFVETYEAERLRWECRPASVRTGDFVSRAIKWTSELEAHLERGTVLRTRRARLREAMYRPFCRRWTYYEDVITHRRYRQGSIFPVSGEWNNTAIVYTQPGSQKPFTALAVSELPDLHLLGAAAGTECLPLYRFENGERHENITDWALDQFRQQYQQSSRTRPITKDAIFRYVYAVLHDPEYLQKYDRNLRRDFPRIPFYRTFWIWADLGGALMDIHLGYAGAEPTPLKRVDVRDERARNSRLAPAVLLRADPKHGVIELDSETALTGIPDEAWQYRLGGRSALEWILDQYKEKKPKDPTVREKFNTYRFADHKEVVVDLLKRVTTVSVETVRVIRAMEKAAR